MTTSTVSWRDTVKKEARGTDDYDLGEVQDTGTYYVHTQRGIEHKTQFFIPKKLFRSYDGKTLVFDVAETSASQFMGTKYPSDADYRAKYEGQGQTKPNVTPRATATDESDIVERIPLMTERLNVTKHLHEDEATITKIPYMETQTKDVEVMHEELRVEEVKASASTKVPDQVKTDLTQEVIRIPIRHEDVDVSKTPEVKEELVIHKTPITETRHISEQIRSEKFEVSDITKANAPDEEKKGTAALRRNNNSTNDT